jgi:hypothetical protein
LRPSWDYFILSEAFAFLTKPNLLKNRDGKPRVFIDRKLLSEEIAGLP